MLLPVKIFVSQGHCLVVPKTGRLFLVFLLFRLFTKVPLGEQVIFFKGPENCNSAVICNASMRPWRGAFGEIAGALRRCMAGAQVLAQTPGVYVPQLGDDVVYLQHGHRLYFEKMNDKRRGPWDTVVSTAVRPHPPLHEALL